VLDEKVAVLVVVVVVEEAAVPVDFGYWMVVVEDVVLMEYHELGSYCFPSS
jgi:hypothetical protein